PRRFSSKMAAFTAGRSFQPSQARVEWTSLLRWPCPASEKCRLHGSLKADPAPERLDHTVLPGRPACRADPRVVAEIVGFGAMASRFTAAANEAEKEPGRTSPPPLGAAQEPWVRLRTEREI